MKKFYVVGVVLFLIAGCAGVKVKEINQDNIYKEGIRFYRPEPYLQVTITTTEKDGKVVDKKVESKILWLPNKKEEYVIKVKSGIGSVNAKIQLQDGWNFTGIDAAVDTKIPEIISALTGAYKAVPIKTPEVKLAEEKPPVIKIQVFLYRLEFDPEKGYVISPNHVNCVAPENHPCD